MNLMYLLKVVDRKEMFVKRSDGTSQNHYSRSGDDVINLTITLI